MRNLTTNKLTFKYSKHHDLIQIFEPRFVEVFLI